MLWCSCLNPLSTNIFIICLPVNDALWEAAKEGQIDKIRDALDNGADINCKLDKGNSGESDYDNSSPLLVASGHGRVLAAEYLILRGGDASTTNQEGLQPIHVAAFYDHVDVISLLLEYGVDINETTKQNGDTALHLASAIGNTASVRFLLENGADTSVKDNFGNRSAFELAGACKKSKKEAVQRVFFEFCGDEYYF